MYSNVKIKVKKLLNGDNTGHNFDHIERVLNLSLKFLKQINDKSIDKDVVILSALLHDADDYKLFGEENAKNLTNARKIMQECNISKSMQDKVCDVIKNMGYNKCLSGIRPTTMEGKIVSDADMCDAMGAVGIIRTHNYSVTHNTPFFDSETLPNLNLSSSEYKSKTSDSSITYFFEKTLKLPGLMLTAPGKIEAEKRHKFLTTFLKEYFKETNSPTWRRYLNNFLKEC